MQIDLTGISNLLIFNCCIIVIMAIIDWYIIEVLKKGIGDTGHIVRFIIKAIKYVFSYFLFIENKEWLTFVLIGIEVSIIDGIIFDVLLNILRGKMFDYVGRKAQSDKPFYEYPMIMLILKFMLFLITSTILFNFNELF